MARYIDADKVKSKLIKLWNTSADEDYKFETLMDYIIDAPTEDVRPVVIGKWIANKFHTTLYCSNCGFTFDIMTNDFMDKMNFCPNCGTDMREVE